MKKLLSVLLVLVFAVLAQNIYADAASDRAEAVKLYSAGDYKAAAPLFEKLFAANSSDKNMKYNTACVWALAGNKTKAFKHLNELADDGAVFLSLLSNDKDFKTLHSDPQWESVVKKVKDNIEKINLSLPEKHTVKQTITLPAPKTDGKVSVEKTMQTRRSVRRYKSDALDLSEVSQLLWAAYGITKPNDSYAFLRGGFRTAPSAGGLYPLDIYLVVGNVKGLEPGIYKYKTSEHKLLLLQSGDVRRELCIAASDQLMVENAPATIVYSAIFERTTKKYGQRGRERYVYMDLGHSAENVYLQAGALNIGTCAIAAFDDLKLKKVVGMTRAEDPLYLMPLGKLKKNIE